MARRFIVCDKDVKCVGDDMFEIKGSEVKHIQVLRHDVGEEITVNDFIFEIVNMRKDSVVLKRLRKAPLFGVPNLNLTLYIAMLKNDKMDLVVQKAVELGCKKIVPFFSKNVIVKLDDKARNKRKDKLQVVADEACKQCGRSDRVEVMDFASFNEVSKNLENYDANFFAYENEKESIHCIMDKVKLNKTNFVSCIVGPEGGFSSEEACILKELPKVYCVSLGSRILRAETACFNLISVIMYELEK